MNRQARSFIAAGLALSLSLIPSAVFANEKVKTKSNIKNDRVAAADACGETCDGLSVSWEGADPQSDAARGGIKLQTSVQWPYKLVRADWTPASGPAFSECSDVCVSTAKVNVQDISMTRRADSGPGIVTLRFSGEGAASADPTACPVPGVDAGPIKGTVIKGGRNPGGNYALREAVITACDASGITISYQGMAINEKGLPGTKAGPKPAAN